MLESLIDYLETLYDESEHRRHEVAAVVMAFVMPWAYGIAAMAYAAVAATYRVVW